MVIMAGGEGRRLRPLTEERPKPLMPLLDEPVLGMTLQLLRRHGAEEATVTVCYRAEQVMRALGDGGAYGVRLRYVREATPRGTAGSVLDAAAGAKGTVLVMSGDGLTDCDLTGLAKRHRQGGGLASLVLKRLDKPEEYGVCELAADGRIVRFTEKPMAAASGSLVNTGIYFLEPEALAWIPARGSCDFGRELLPELVAADARVMGLETDAYWCDIGSREAYAQAQMDLLLGRVGLAIRGRRQGGAILAPGMQLAPGVQVTGRCYVGQNAHIGAGTVLGPGTVVGRGAQVGRNVRMEHACLWENARVGGDAILRNVVVMPRAGNETLQRVVPYA